MQFFNIEVKMSIDEKCCCCKEPIGTIPIGRIIDKLDILFGHNQMEEAGEVLRYWENEARALYDSKGLLEILSEEIGYYRKVGDKARGLHAVDEALTMLECMDIEGSVNNATIVLNCGTTMKAFGKAEEAIPLYERAKEVYKRLLPKDDFRLAGLYNNYATALKDLERYDEARENFLKAIAILEAKEDVYGEVAVSYVNLAHLEFDAAYAKGEVADDKVDECLKKAWECLDSKDIKRDGNYAFICEKCAPAYEFFGWFIEKAELEKRAQDIYNAK